MTRINEIVPQRSVLHIAGALGAAALLFVAVLTETASASGGVSPSSQRSSTSSELCGGGEIIPDEDIDDEEEAVAMAGSAPSVGFAEASESEALASSWTVHSWYTDVHLDAVPLRYGSSTWGYYKLQAKGRWSSTFQQQMRTTLRYGRYVYTGGRSYRFWKIIGTNTQCQPVYMKVVVEYTNNQGIITAYRSLTSG